MESFVDVGLKYIGVSPLELAVSYRDFRTMQYVLLMRCSRHCSYLKWS